MVRKKSNENTYCQNGYDEDGSQMNTGLPWMRIKCDFIALVDEDQNWGLKMFNKILLSAFDFIHVKI